MRREDALALFERRVVKTEPDPEGDEHFTLVTLDCGHQLLVVCYTPVPTMPCSQCVHKLLEDPQG